MFNVQIIKRVVSAAVLTIMVGGLVITPIINIANAADAECYENIVKLTSPGIQVGGDSAEASIKNRSSVDCKVTLVSYNINKNRGGSAPHYIQGQTIYRTDTRVLAPRQTVTLSVGLPACYSQIDLVHDEAKEPPTYQGDQMIGVQFAGDPSQYCDDLPPPPPPVVPSVDIKANGSDGPITIAYNTAATISWTSANTTSCVISPKGWTGTSGSLSSGALDLNQTFTAQCVGTNGATVTDNVTVNVSAQVPPPIGPGTLTGVCVNPTSQSPSIRLNWTSGTNANSNSIEKGDFYPNDPNRFWEFIMQDPSLTLRTFTDTSVTKGIAYSYRVKYAPAVPSNVVVVTCPLDEVVPAPTADIKANGSDGPITIAYNTAATISWTSTNANSCTVSPTGWTGTSGSQSSGALTGTKTFTLNCIGANNQSVSDTVTVNVTAQCVAPTVTTNGATNVTVNSATLNGTVDPNGQSTNVYFEYGTSQNFGTIVGNQTISGNNPVAVTAQINNLQPNTTYYFRLVASNNCGGANVTGAINTFTTGANAPTADIKANGQDGVVTVQYNTSANITWTSTNANTCSVSPTGWTGTSGSQSSGNITGSITYTLTCTGSNGQTASDSVTVQPTGNNQLPTVTLVANPTVINMGQSSVLSWNSNNATNCYASAGPWSGNKSLAGSETVTPSLTSTYTITCSNNFGSASAVATVVVNNNASNNSISVTKFVRNITLNQVNFSQSVQAQGLDNLEFEIRVRNTDTIGRTITVQDILPQELFYVSGSTTLNGASYADGIVGSGLNLGFMNPGEERVIRFRSVVFAGTSNRTITNQANASGVSASASANAFGNAFATVQIVNRGQVLGVSDIATGPEDTLMVSALVGFMLALALSFAGKRFGWFNTYAPVGRVKRDIEEVLQELQRKANAS